MGGHCTLFAVALTAICRCIGSTFMLRMSKAGLMLHLIPSSSTKWSAQVSSPRSGPWVSSARFTLQYVFPCFIMPLLTVLCPALCKPTAMCQVSGRQCSMFCWINQWGKRCAHLIQSKAESPVAMNLSPADFTWQQLFQQHIILPCRAWTIPRPSAQRTETAHVPHLITLVCKEPLCAYTSRDLAPWVHV